MAEASPALVVRFEGALTVREAHSIRDALSAALHSGNAVIVDCRDAADVDLSFVQMLIAARLSAAAHRTSFALAAPAEGPLLRVLNRAGLLDPARPDAADGFWTGDRPEQP
ncbi:MAG TPA: STAS domain-containing protein [Rhodospirillales bacterium]|nr:STAS domain-containing protein [Rhodospirillales bacterium]